MWTSGCLMEWLCWVLSCRKTNLWPQHAQGTHSWLLPQPYPSPPASRHLYTLSSDFLSTHKSPLFTYLLILNIQTPYCHHLTLKPRASPSIWRLCHHNWRLLILAELSMLPRVIRSLLLFLSSCNCPFKSSPLSSSLCTLCHHLLHKTFSEVF